MTSRGPFSPELLHNSATETIKQPYKTTINHKPHHFQAGNSRGQNVSLPDLPTDSSTSFTHWHSRLLTHSLQLSAWFEFRNGTRQNQTWRGKLPVMAFRRKHFQSQLEQKGSYSTPKPTAFSYFTPLTMNTDFLRTPWLLNTTWNSPHTAQWKWG